MTIVKITAPAFLLTFLIGTSSICVHPSLAGFQISNSPAPVGTSTATEPTAQEILDVPPKAMNQPEVKTSKALQIFDDRYVPDSVRKKYNLPDDWFGKQKSPPVVVAPEVKEVIEVSPPQALEPVAITPEADSKNLVDSWRARKGENLRDVLQRWSVRGNTDLMWAAPDAPTLQKDFSFFGKYKDAVNTLIKLEGGDKIHTQYRAEGLNPVMMSPASTVTTNSAPAAEDVAPKEVQKSEAKSDVNPLAQIFVPQKKVDKKPETRWFGLSGAPLAEVIRVWADDAGVQLVWQSEKNFALKESISQVGYFEDAVFSALSQYNGEDIRPVGEIYHDPRSGQQVLLVRTEVN